MISKVTESVKMIGGVSGKGLVNVMQERRAYSICTRLHQCARFASMA